MSLDVLLNILVLSGNVSYKYGSDDAPVESYLRLYDDRYVSACMKRKMSDNVP